MERFSKWFVVSSLLYLLVGSLLGVTMALYSAEWKGLEYYLLPAHTHLNLIGWVSMMIFGVAYHILPRFSGRPLYSRKLAWLHFYMAQAALIGMAIFFFLNRLQEGAWKRWVAISGILMFISFSLFIFNLLKTLNPREASE